LHGKNVKEIKKIQENIKHKKLEKENYVPPEPFKMKEFKNVSSKIDTINTTKLHPKQDDGTMKKNKSTTLLKPKSAQNAITKNSKPEKTQINNIQKYQSDNYEEDIYSIGKNVPDSNDYKIFSQKDYVISTVNYETSGGQTNTKVKENLSYGHNQSKSQTKLPTIKNNNKIRQDTQKSKSKTKIKGPTPKADEVNSLLPKKSVNHIQENKSLNAVPNRAKNVEIKDEEQFEHKNYGKVPD
jgi:hypothetical protein